MSIAEFGVRQPAGAFALVTGKAATSRRTPKLIGAHYRVWSSVLGVANIGLDENFFELGGHSLLAVRLFAGGIIAYEMACQLRAVGQTVACVALLDSYPVGYERLSASSSLLQSRTRRTLRRVAAHLANIRSLPLREKAGYVFQKSKYGPVQVKSKLWRILKEPHVEELAKQLNECLLSAQSVNGI